MPLKFNGKDLTASDYSEVVRQNMPKGKNKLVTFVLNNARPFQVRDDKGNQSQRISGETSIHAFDTVRTYLKEHGGEVEGVLQYYATSTKRATGRGDVIDNMEPAFLHFTDHKMTFDAEKNPTLFYFMLTHSTNVENSGKYGKVPEFKLVRPAEGAKKSVASIDLEFEAISKVKELQKNNKKQLRAFYEALGGNDFDDKKDAGDWESILEPLYAKCKSDPKKALEMMDDAGLNIAAKVVKALALGIIKQDGGNIVWGDHIQPEMKKRKITGIPKMRATDWQEWFTNDFLRSEVEVVEVLNIELNVVELSGK
jgi:hypothetical protein